MVVATHGNDDNEKRQHVNGCKLMKIRVFPWFLNFHGIDMFRSDTWVAQYGQIPQEGPACIILHKYVCLLFTQIVNWFRCKFIALYSWLAIARNLNMTFWVAEWDEPTYKITSSTQNAFVTSKSNSESLNLHQGGVPLMYPSLLFRQPLHLSSLARYLPIVAESYAKYA